MNELIKTSSAVIGGEEQQTVNARDLWKALGSNRKFADWIKDRLDGFSDGSDYAIHKIVKRDKNGATGVSWSKEYTLTLDVAKHLAMLERNERGRKIRQYFIEIEKEYRRQFNRHAADIEKMVDLVIARRDKNLIEIAKKAAQVEQQNNFLRAFAPDGKPGELSKKTGEPKLCFRRGYYTRGTKARSVMVLFSPDLPFPELFC